MPREGNQDALTLSHISKILETHTQHLNHVMNSVDSLRAEFQTKIGSLEAAIQQQSNAAHRPMPAPTVAAKPRGSRRKLVVQDEDEEEEEECMVAAKPVRKQLMIQEEDELASGQKKLAVEAVDEPEAAPRKKKLVILEESSEDEEPRQPLRTVPEPGSCQTGPMRARRALQIEEQEEEELPEVDPSLWMTDRRPAPVGQTFHTYGRGAFTSEGGSSEDESSEEEDWRATRRAMIQEQKRKDSQNLPDSSRSSMPTAAAPERSQPVQLPVVEEHPAGKQAAEEEDDEARLKRITKMANALEKERAAKQQAEQKKEAEKQAEVARREEERAAAMEAMLRRKETEEAIHKAAELEKARLAEAAEMRREELMEEEAAEVAKAKVAAAKKKEAAQARLQEQAKKRAERKQAEATRRQEEQLEREAEAAAQAELDRKKKIQQAELEALKQAEKEAAEVRAEQEMFARQELLRMQEQAEAEAQEYEEFLKMERAALKDQIRNQMTKPSLVHQLHHDWVDDAELLPALPPQLWGAVATPSDDLYEDEDRLYQEARAKYAVLKLQLAAPCVLPSLLAWIVGSLSETRPEVYPPAPDFPGKLMGLTLSSQEPSGKAVLLVGLEISISAEELAEVLSKIVLRDFLSGEAMTALMEQHKDAKTLSLAQIGRVLQCKQGHPLAVFGQAPSLWLDGECGPAVEGLETTVCMMKPHTLEQHLIAPVLQHLDTANLALVGARLIWFTPSHTQTLSCFSPYIPPPAAPTLILAARAKNAVATWLAAIGPDDPVLARRTDPGSLRAEHGHDRSTNLLVCTRSSERSRRDVALFFGGRLTPEYCHDNALAMILPFRPTEQVLVLRPEMAVARYAGLLGSLGSHNLVITQCCWLEPSQGLAIQLDLTRGRRAMVVAVSAEDSDQRLKAWLKSLDPHLRTQVSVCTLESDEILEANKCLVMDHSTAETTLEARGHEQEMGRQAEPGPDDEDGEQTVVAVVAAQCGRAAASVIAELFGAGGEGSTLIGFKTIMTARDRQGWEWGMDLLANCTGMSGSAQVQGRVDKYGGFLVVMRGYGLREAWTQLVKQFSDQLVIPKTNHQTTRLLHGFFDHKKSELQLPKGILSVSGLFAASLPELALLCIKGTAAHRQLPKVLKMLGQGQGFQLLAIDQVRYAEVQQHFEKVHVAGSPDSLGVLVLLERKHAQHKLAQLLSVQDTNSLSFIFGAECFSVPHSPQHLEHLVTFLKKQMNSGIDMAGSRCVLKRPPSICETICVALLPQLTQTGDAFQVLDKLLREGFKLVGIRFVVLSSGEAVHYGSISRHNLLVPEGSKWTVLALERDNCISQFHAVLGSPLSHSKAPLTSRDPILHMRNSSLVEQFGAHQILASTSVDRARKELALFFAELNGEDQIGAAML
eukprot:TRINITY_DN13497_c0_g1_i3.p1 TRINITY_DN13497_c0_g1~~TRINITY_DN13497_c0_g1_i3.p1  ORF type:complete len:1395 (+),score=417.08 TRINITY_DN13497_c0_g1_i3:247-4431(+)